MTYGINAQEIPVGDFQDLSDLHLSRASRFVRFCVRRRGYYRPRRWDHRQQSSFVSSLLHFGHVFPIVLRQMSPTEFEVFDGWQRIRAIRAFFNDEIPLPPLSSSTSQWLPYTPWHTANAGHSITGLSGYYSVLPANDQQFCKNVKLKADIIIGIGNENDPSHQNIARLLFYRFQSGMR